MPCVPQCSQRFGILPEAVEGCMCLVRSLERPCSLSHVVGRVAVDESGSIRDTEVRDETSVCSRVSGVSFLGSRVSSDGEPESRSSRP